MFFAAQVKEALDAASRLPAGLSALGPRPAFGPGRVDGCLRAS